MAGFSGFEDRYECARAPGGGEGVVFPKLV